MKPGEEKAPAALQGLACSTSGQPKTSLGQRQVLLNKEPSFREVCRIMGLDFFKPRTQPEQRVEVDQGLLQEEQLELF